MKKTIALLILALLAQPLTVHSCSAKAKELLKQANDAAAKHISNQCTYEETVRLYKMAIAESNDDPYFIMEFVKKSLYMMKFQLPEKHLDNAVTYYRKAAAKGVEDFVTMREIGYSYIHYIANDAEGFKWLNEAIGLAEKKMDETRKSGDTTYATGCRNEILAAYNAMALSFNYNATFEKSAVLLASIEKKYPESRKAGPLNNFARSYLWLAMISLGDGDFSAAGRHLAAAENIVARTDWKDGTTDDIKYYRKLLSECAAVRGKKPAYTQKLMILYVGKGRMRRIVPKTIPAEQFEGFKEKLGNYDYDILKRCYTLNAERSVYELSRKGMDELIPLAGKNIEESVISRLLGSILYKDSSEAEYYPEEVMTETEFVLTKTYVNLLGRQVQAMTKGNLALQFRHEYLKDAAMTGYAPNYVFGFAPDYKKIEPYPGELIFDAVNKCDGIFLITANRISPNCGYAIVAYGGTNLIPIIPYVLDSPSRGMVRISNEKIRHSYGEMFFHEYFHMIENLWDLPTHAQQNSSNFSLYRNLEGSDNNLEFDYFRWQLGTKIPAKIEEMRAKGDNSGWAHFSWTRRKPFRLSREAFNILLNKAKGVSLEDRREALDLLEKGKRARANKDLELADRLYRQALKLNPACIEAYRCIGDRAAEEKKYKEAADSYAEYLTCADDTRLLSKTAGICIRYLEDNTRGMAYADRGIDLEEDMKKKVGWCREAANAFWAKKKYRDAARYYERGASFNFGKDSLECVFFKGEAFYADGDREKGKSLMRASYEKGLKGDKRFDEKMTKRYK